MTERRPADARRMLAEVTSLRRQLSDEELAALGPGLDTFPRPSGPTDPTRVVHLDRPVPARRGDTGPLDVTPVPTPRRRRRGRGPLLLVLVLVLAVALSGLAWFYASVLTKTTTPSLLKLTQAEAAQRAARSGLDVRVIDREYSEVVARGLVLRTDPSPGARIDKDGTIGLVLSRGPERYDVPQLAGKSEEVARQLIEEANLSVGDGERRYSTKVDKGAVIETRPAAGTPLKAGEAVVLVVSDGPRPVAVPTVTSMPVAEARRAIKDAGLRVAVTEEFHDTAPAGTVVSQTPEGGATADERSQVRLVVSKGPPLVVVPDVVGQPLGAAQALLSGAGFQVNVNQIPGPGIVRSQSPGAGEEQPKGTTVTLYVF